MDLDLKGVIWGILIVMLFVAGVYAAVVHDEQSRIDDQRAAVEKQKSINAWIGGEHLLRKMAERTSQEGYISGSFFLFAGAISGENKTIPKVAFSWLMNDKRTYQISTLPLTKTRVVFADVTQPSIQFHWSEKRFSYGADYLNTDIQRALDDLVDYMVITCKESDWKPNVQLPLNQ